jgi:hypothetical protein
MPVTGELYLFNAQSTICDVRHNIICHILPCILTSIINILHIFNAVTAIKQATFQAPY